MLLACDFDGGSWVLERSLAASLLRRAMTARAELDLSSYDRFFPSQDFMPKGSFGLERCGSSTTHSLARRAQ